MNRRPSRNAGLAFSRSLAIAALAANPLVERHEPAEAPMTQCRRAHAPFLVRLSQAEPTANSRESESNFALFSRNGSELIGLPSIPNLH